MTPGERLRIVGLCCDDMRKATRNGHKQIFVFDNIQEVGPYAGLAVGTTVPVPRFCTWCGTRRPPEDYAPHPGRSERIRKGIG